MKQGETFYLFLICISGISGLPWYQGCFHGNGTTTTSDVLVLPRNDSLPVSPSDCSRQCLVTGYAYTVVKGSSCDCTSDITGYLQTTEDRCNNSCLLGTVSSVCNSNSSLGGASEEFVSVFTTEGPFISHVEVLVLSSPVYVGHVVPLEVRVQLGGLPETGEGFLGLNGSDFGELFFVWSLDGVQFRQDNISALENETFVLPIIHTFSQPGWTWLGEAEEWLKLLFSLKELRAVA
ncbi:uncharacterized protein LOC106173648 [Lingula anatina]|uniref:Uncharacterized protein LOC106173648 n=1 Tax=Lingula anatina TaxID=7574 RepID=A0A1S3JIV0_LINAN|nr:uncharacterized protein LOC106173648 [Lingula anatina]|eukprot:XP_013410298.1 uncharacterized protein LOC106173648 [Lingula anatina]